MRKMMLGVALVSTILGIGVGCGAGIGEDSTEGEDEESLGAEESELSSDGGVVIRDSGVVPSDGSVGTGDAGWPNWDGGPIDYDGGGVADAGGIKYPRLSGVWGGENASLTVTKGEARLVLPCSLGTFKAPFVYTASSGDGGVPVKYFWTDGTFYPSTAGASMKGVSAYFAGRIERGTMRLTVTTFEPTGGSSDAGFVSSDAGGSRNYTYVLKRNVVSAFPVCY